MYGLPKEKLKALLIEEAQKMWKPISGKVSGTSSQWNLPVMETQINYALGTQSPMSYNLAPDVSPNDKKLIFYGDSRNVQFANKMLTTAIGLLGKEQFEPQVHRIDFAARDFRKEYRKKLEFAVIAKQVGLDIEAMAQELQLTPEEIPDKPQYIDTLINGNQALQDEANMVKALMQTHDHYNFDTMMDEVTFYVLCNGVGGIRIDTSGPEMVIRKINPRYTTTSFSNKDDCTDITSYAEVVPYSLVWLKSNIMSQLEPDEWQKIESVARTYESIRRIGFQNFVGTQGQAAIENEKFVLVLDFEFIRSFRGDFRFYGSSMNFQVGKSGKSIYDSKQWEFSFTGKYVVNADVLFNYGMVVPQPRDTMPVDPRDLNIVNPLKTRLGVIMHRPMQTEGVSVTWIDRIMPHIDTLQRLTDQYNNLVNNIKPGITAIDLDMLSDIQSDEGVRSLDTVRKILTRYMKNGDIFFSSSKVSDYRGGTNRVPFNSSEDRTVIQLAQTLDQIRGQMEIIREYCGIPAIADGIVEERTGAKVADGALSSVSTGLRIYSKARQSIYERTMKQLCLIYQYTGNAGCHGQEDYEVNEADFRNYIFNTTTKLKPTELDYQRLYASADAAYAQGQGWLSYADLIYITTNPVLQDAQNHFIYLDNINRKREQAAKAADIEGNAQVQQQSAEIATQGKIAEIQAKAEAETMKQQNADKTSLDELMLEIKAENDRFRQDLEFKYKELASKLDLQNAEKEKIFAETEAMLAEPIAKPVEK